jgi:hypothetical protein
VGQRGQALIETLVATAIAAIALGAVLAATIAIDAHFGPDPARSALDAAAHRELAIAVNLAKYQGTTLQPSTISTTIPLPDGSPLPATLQLQDSPLPGGGSSLTILANATWHGATESLSLSTTTAAPAPIPGSTVALPGLAPAPTGAP